MIYHAQSVVRAVNRAMVVVDLPFGSYQSNSEIALSSAIRIMKESGAHAIKLEGGSEVEESIRRIVQAGIPVMGHLGLTPQSIYKFGTYTVRAKEEQEAQKLRDDAKLLDELGCYALVLEKIPAQLTKEVSEAITIPTIGIGAGKHADGQVLVTHDMLGITKDFKPRFLRRYAELFDVMTDATQRYIADIKAKDFPNDWSSIELDLSHYVPFLQLLSQLRRTLEMYSLDIQRFSAKNIGVAVVNKNGLFPIKH